MTSRYEAQQKLHAFEDRISNPCGHCTYSVDRGGCTREDGCAPHLDQLGWAVKLLEELVDAFPDPQLFIQRLGAWSRVGFTVRCTRPGGGTVSLRSCKGSTPLVIADLAEDTTTVFPSVLTMREPTEVWGTAGITVESVVGFTDESV